MKLKRIVRELIRKSGIYDLGKRNKALLMPMLKYCGLAVRKGNHRILKR